MIPKGLFTQIGMIMVSVAIIITYIKPTFGEIGVVQDEIAVYKAEREKVVGVNSRLAEFVTRLDSVSNEDQRKLLMYMPDAVDDIAVPRDLALIAKQSGAVYVQANSEGSGSDKSKSKKSSGVQEDALSTAYNFSLSVEGTYQQLKNLLGLLEKNKYPLEVHSLAISPMEGEFLSAEIGLVTYEYLEMSTSNQQIEF